MTPLRYRSGLVAMVALMIWAFPAACSLLRGGREPTARPSSYGLQPIALEEYWSEAMAMAEDWRPDAYVREVSIDVELPESPASRSFVEFDILSPSEDMVSLSVHCKEGDCESLEFDQNPGYPVLQCSPIELGDPSLTSQEALEIGIANGGRQFVYDSNASLSLTLSHISGNQICSDRLTWMVDFFDPITRGVQMLMDAKTGEILE